MSVSVVSRGKKSQHTGADRNQDEGLGRTVLLVLWQTLIVIRGWHLLKALLAEQSMKFTCSKVPKADGAPPKINRLKKALKMTILEDRFILLSMYSAWLL